MYRNIEITATDIKKLSTCKYAIKRSVQSIDQAQKSRGNFKNWS